jgi:decaprenylphospho-beta-D-erythro-pentofuranosid-2-ulose 2-reductase
MTDGVGRPQSVAVFGGGSDIGVATARRLVEHGASRVVLAARDPSRLPGEEALRAAGFLPLS